MRPTPLSSVLLLAFVLLGAEILCAQSVMSADSLDLPEAVVVAGRPPIARQSIGHTFDVLTREDLSQLPISSTAEALAFVSGLDVRARGPRGVQADLSIRGGTFDQTVVLVNGVRLSDPQTGHHVMNIPVPLENIERIEVLKGPGARLYGQNAFAGAINIVTRVPATESTEIRGVIGENGLGGFGVSLSLPKGAFRQNLSFQRDFAEDYEVDGEDRSNTDWSIQNIFYQSELKAGASTYGFMAGLSERAFGANGYYAGLTSNEYEEVQTSFVALTHQKELRNGTFSQRLNWRRNQDEYIFIRENPSIFRNLHISHVVSWDGFRSIENKLGRLGIGAELQGVTLRSNRLGAHERFVGNVVAEQQFDFGDLRVTPGLTFNYISDAGARLLPGLDIAYTPSPTLTFYGNAGMTYRVPTYTDFFYAGPLSGFTAQGNPDLVAERAYAFELGVTKQAGPFELNAAVWQREAIDLIDYVRESPTDSIWQPLNFSEATFRGVELKVEARNLLRGYLTVRANYAYIDASLPSEGGENDFISRYALDNLRHQVNVAATVRIAPWMTATATFRHADRVLEPEAGRPDVDYAIFDLRADFRSREKLSLFVEATNVTDEVYAQVSDVPQPGRWVRGGATLRF